MSQRFEATVGTRFVGIYVGESSQKGFWRWCRRGFRNHPQYENSVPCSHPLRITPKRNSATVAFKLSCKHQIATLFRDFWVGHSLTFGGPGWCAKRKPPLRLRPFKLPIFGNLKNTTLLPQLLLSQIEHIMLYYFWPGRRIPQDRPFHGLPNLGNHKMRKVKGYPVLELRAWHPPKKK